MRKNAPEKEKSAPEENNSTPKRRATADIRLLNEKRVGFLIEQKNR